MTHEGLTQAVDLYRLVVRRRAERLHTFTGQLERQLVDKGARVLLGVETPYHKAVLLGQRSQVRGHGYRSRSDVGTILVGRSLMRKKAIVF